MKYLALAILALSLNSAFAASNCAAQFKRNLEEIQRRSRSMSPKCWQQVQKGNANTANIMSTCNDREIDLAQAMEPFENRNVALCNGACSKDLNAIQVCIDGKPLGYYFSKLK